MAIFSIFLHDCYTISDFQDTIKSIYLIWLLSSDYNFNALEVVSHLRDSLLQVDQNYSYWTKWIEANDFEIWSRWF